jgi:hypothetical protein
MWEDPEVEGETPTLTPDDRASATPALVWRIVKGLGAWLLVDKDVDVDVDVAIDAGGPLLVSAISFILYKFFFVDCANKRIYLFME